MELVAQGIGNLFAPLFGGIPATGAIARTAINIKNGGRTPVAGMTNAFVLLVIMLFLGNYMKSIPMACLAGILIVVAYNMSEWRSFRSLVKTSNSSAAVVLTTFVLTIFTDLTFAIEIGLILASLMFIGKMTLHTNVTKLDLKDDDNEVTEDLQEELEKLNIEKLPDEILVYEINGPLFFGAAYKFKEEMDKIQQDTAVIIIRMRNVPMMDSSGINFLRDVLKSLRKKRTVLILSGLQRNVAEMINKSGLAKEIGLENIYSRFDLSVRKAIKLYSERNPQPGKKTVSLK
jgi:SulP family sulfate permease